jgi:hypothetical protein
MWGGIVSQLEKANHFGPNRRHQMATTANVNMLAGVKFMLLGTELNAGFEQTDSGKHIFVFQDLSSANAGVTVDQLVSDVKNLMGKNRPTRSPD